MLALLGEPRFESRPIPLERVTYLLALLACRAEWVSREELVLMLWGDTDEAAGRQRLRQLLYRARSFPHADGLETDSKRVRLTAPNDLSAFRDALRESRYGEAVARYGGELLHGVTFPDTPELEEFFALTREELSNDYRRAVLAHVATQAPKPALETLETALQRDPFSEDLLRETLRLAAGADATLGRRAFETHARALRALDLEPDEEFIQLAANLETQPKTVPIPRVQSVTSKLPVATTAFVGRERELRAVAEQFAAPHQRLLTILGPGGAGKTRLSVEVALAHAASFRDGATFVEFAPVEKTELAPDATLEALGSSKGSDSREALLNHLAPLEKLLVMDNLEHLPGIGALVADILERAPGVKILVTSREALSLRAEHVIELEGLPAPDTLFPLETQDAALLFLRAAQRMRADFRLQPNVGKADLTSFTRIYSAVSGMPLGLELAASWVRVMSLPEIADELERSLDVLEVDSADMPARHRSFAAAFRSSWTLLNQNEQHALARMSVFRGGFTREMAASVAGSSLPTLLRLVNKSMVSRRETRFFLHEMIRQYAERELPDAEREASLAALTRACLELSEIWYESFKGEQQVEWSRRLEQEHDNIRSALNWSLKNDVRIGADIAGNLEHFWYTRGYHREGLDWAQRFLSRPETEPRDKLRLRLLWVTVSLYKELAEFDRSQAAVGEYAQLAEELHDERGIAGSQKFMGLLLRERGDSEDALAFLERARIMFEALEDRNQIGICWNDIGITHVYTGNLEEAKQCFEQSLEIKREIGDKQGVAYALANLGNVASMQGDDELDRVLQEESLRIKRELGDASGIANSLQALGSMAREAKNYGLARAYFHESLEILQRLGKRLTMAHLILDFADLDHHLNRFDRAIRLGAAATAGLRRIGSVLRQGSLKMIARFNSEHPFTPAERMQYELEGERMTLEEAVTYVFNDPDALKIDIATATNSDPDPQASLH